MIVSFKHKGLKALYEKGATAGVRQDHIEKLLRILTALDTAQTADDMNYPGFSLHQLKGSRRDIWSVKVNGNWRITWRFIGRDVEIVNYEDYH